MINARNPVRALFVVALAAVAMPAAAQTVPKVEVGIGYQASHIPDNWNPLGFNFDVAVTMMGHLSVVGEVGLTRDSDEEGSFEATLTDWNYGGGVRWSGRMAPLSGYFQGIAGALHRKFEFDGDSDAATKFMIQPSAGISFDLMQNAGVFADLGYRRIFLDEDEDGDSGENQFRIVAGVRIGFPRR